MRTVLPSNLEALKMDIDKQEMVEFNDRDNSAAMFVSARGIRSVTKRAWPGAALL